MHLRLTEQNSTTNNRKFVEKELMPLENEVLRNERRKTGLTERKIKRMQESEKLLWGINTKRIWRCHLWP